MSPTLRSKTVLIVCCLVLVTAGGCVGSGGNGGDGQSTTTTSTYAISGTVVDARTHDPLGGVAVTVGEQTATTGSEGQFQLTGVPPGEYALGLEKAGYQTRSIEIRLASDREVRFELRDESFYEPDQSPLVQAHWQANVTCEPCHGSPQGAITEPAPAESCIECHPLADLRNATAAQVPNPHQDPHGIYRDCGRCHRVHEASVDACAECHSSNTIPPVP